MTPLNCPACGTRAFFQTLTCGCGAALGFDPDARTFRTGAALCANRDAIACNWIADGAHAGALCRSCAMTRVIPDLDVGDNAFLWAEAESAKRRSLFNLMAWGWFGPADPGERPVFDLLAEDTATGEAQVTMGHADGVVTINVAESDPAVREARRADLDERLRTMTGHFRHELGHFVFARLAGRAGFLSDFRALMGDERADYAEALRRHYAQGPAPDWPQRCVTPYAAAHPHEDWAESFAHLLHLTDIVATAAALDLSCPSLEAAGPGFDPYAAPEAEPMLTIAVEFGLALNAVNRAMGLHDVYPFVLTPLTREKLGFVRSHVARGPAA
ncbi:MAG: putative zinc-binding metallopeptidase [Rubrimonas sp.]